MKSNIKNAVCTVFTALFTAAVTIPAAAVLLGKGLSAEEASDAAGDRKKAFSDIAEQRFSQALPFRNAALTASAKLKAAFSTGSDEVIIGKNGWYFYRDSLDRYTGAERLSDREIYAAARYLYLLQQYCDEKGISFIFTAAPDKARIYDSELPDYVRRAEGQSELERLYSQLEEMGVAHIELAPLFDAENSPYEYYYKTDTHWNSIGALTAVNGIMSALGRSFDDHSGAEFTLDGVNEGDLTRILFPSESITEKYYVTPYNTEGLRFIQPSSVEGSRDVGDIMDNLTGSSERYDSIIRTSRADAPNGSLVMRRDSFGRAMLPFLTESYRSAYFTRSEAVSSAELTGADDFIYEIVERNIGNITSKPCYIPAPRVNEPAASGRINGSCEISAEYDLLYISGSLEEAAVEAAPRSEIVITLKNGGTSASYEAFPCGKNGFGAYIDASPIPNGSYDIYAACADKTTDIIGKVDILH